MGFLVFVNVNVINHVILVSTQIIKKSKCRKRLTEKLVEDCNETVDEVKLTKITHAENENKYKCNSCILYTVLFSIFLTFDVVIGAYFVYYKYMNRNKKMFLNVMIMFI